MIIATCHNTSIRFLEIFNVDKKVRWLSDRVHVSLITRCELSRILPYDTLVDIPITDSTNKDYHRYRDFF